jgi:hypothetical protein
MAPTTTATATAIFKVEGVPGLGLAVGRANTSPNDLLENPRYCNPQHDLQQALPLTRARTHSHWSHDLPTLIYCLSNITIAHIGFAAAPSFTFLTMASASQVDGFHDAFVRLI